MIAKLLDFQVDEFRNSRSTRKELLIKKSQHTMHAHMLVMC